MATGGLGNLKPSPVALASATNPCCTMETPGIPNSSTPTWLRTNHDVQDPQSPVEATNPSPPLFLMFSNHSLEASTETGVSNHSKLIPSYFSESSSRTRSRAIFPRALWFQYKPIFLFFKSFNLGAWGMGLNRKIPTGFETRNP